MNKTELVEKVALQAGLTKTQADAAIKAFVDTVTEALKDGDKISLKGFGTFEVRERNERTARNPRTGETIIVPATTIPAFKASSALKKELKK